MKTLKIKATSGGVRGQAESGQLFDYSIDRDSFIGLASQVYDLALAAMNPENKKSGGYVSQMLHAYGVTADKLETFGGPVFPTCKFAAHHPDDGGEPKVYDTREEMKKALGDRLAFHTVEEVPQPWKEENTEAWLEAMAMKKAREQKPLEERQKEWNAKAAALIAAGLNPGDFLSPKVRPVK